MYQKGIQKIQEGHFLLLFLKYWASEIRNYLRQKFCWKQWLLKAVSVFTWWYWDGVEQLITINVDLTYTTYRNRIINEQLLRKKPEFPWDNFKKIKNNIVIIWGYCLKYSVTTFLGWRTVWLAFSLYENLFKFPWNHC